jgi:hypothetical protein
MSIELTPVVVRNGECSLTQFGGGADGRCLQLNVGFDGFVVLTVDQAKNMAAALLEFADGTRKDFLGWPCGKFPKEQE